MKISKILLLAVATSPIFASSQFTNIYETKAVCTTVSGVEYCYMTEKIDVFAVMNYQEVAGKILFHGKGYPEYIPTGNASNEENSKGVAIYQNDYMSKSTGKEFNIMYSKDNLWFSSGWNGKTYCQITKYWVGDKSSFKATYKFKEVFSADKLKELSKRCYDEMK